MNDVKRRLRIFLVLLISITILGSIGFMFLERLSFLDALYYNIVTMSTVGYGDIHPTHSSTRLLAIFIIVLGSGAFIGVIANATEMMLLQREHKQRMKKQNIVLGIFFSEIGYHLLTLFSSYGLGKEKMSDFYKIDMDWSDNKLLEMFKTLEKNGLKVDITKVNLNGLNQFLRGRHKFVLSLLENPVLIEQERFTELLLAIAHINEELASRESLDALPESDLNHLAGDINRGYSILVEEWLTYLMHLKKHYSYLYSLAVRKNPFNPNASAVIKDD